MGAEPYKCDNAKLVQECNELHLAFLQYREQQEKVQKGRCSLNFCVINLLNVYYFVDLKKRVSDLQAEVNNFNLERINLKKHIKELENQTGSYLNSCNEYIKYLHIKFQLRLRDQLKKFPVVEYRADLC